MSQPVTYRAAQSSPVVWSLSSETELYAAFFFGPAREQLANRVALLLNEFDGVEDPAAELARLRGIDAAYQQACSSIADMAASVKADKSTRHPGARDDSDPINAPWVVVDKPDAPMLFLCHFRGWMGRPDDSSPYLTYSEAVEDAKRHGGHVVSLWRLPCR